MHHITSYHIISHHITSYHIISHSITPHQIISYHIISYHIRYHIHNISHIHYIRYITIMHTVHVPRRGQLFNSTRLVQVQLEGIEPSSPTRNTWGALPLSYNKHKAPIDTTGMVQAITSYKSDSDRENEMM